MVDLFYWTKPLLSFVVVHGDLMLKELSLQKIEHHDDAPFKPVQQEKILPFRWKHKKWNKHYGDQNNTPSMSIQQQATYTTPSWDNLPQNPISSTMQVWLHTNPSILDPHPTSMTQVAHFVTSSPSAPGGVFPTSMLGGINALAPHGGLSSIQPSSGTHQHAFHWDPQL